jgi:hypothetical protein
MLLLRKLRILSRSNEQQYVQSGMSKVFIYEPEKRVTVKELLQDPSFRAIMER